MKDFKKHSVVLSQFAALPEEEKLAFIERIKSSGLPPKEIDFMISNIKQIMQVASKLQDDNATFKDIQEIYGIKTT